MAPCLVDERWPLLMVPKMLFTLSTCALAEILGGEYRETQMLNRLLQMYVPRYSVPSARTFFFFPFSRVCVCACLLLLSRIGRW